MAPGQTKRQPQNAPADMSASPRPAQYHHVHQHSVVSDVDGDLDSDALGSAAIGGMPSSAEPNPRTNAELNISVLRRHYPEVVAILSIAPYAVVYLFSNASQTWEKSGVEGTLFVCQLASVLPDGTASGLQHNHGRGVETLEERFAVIVLNRRGLENLELELRTEEDIDVAGEYVILQGPQQPAESPNGRSDTGGSLPPTVYGIWIFTEPPPSSTAEMRKINAKVILDCASRARYSRQRAFAWDLQNPTFESAGRQPEGGPASSADTVMARQLSLRELFSKSNEQESATTASDAEHKPAPAGRRPGPTPSMQVKAPFSRENNANQAAPNVLDDLFRKARQSNSGG